MKPPGSFFLLAALQPYLRPINFLTLFFVQLGRELCGGVGNLDRSDGLRTLDCPLSSCTPHPHPLGPLGEN